MLQQCFSQDEDTASLTTRPPSVTPLVTPHICTCLPCQTQLIPGVRATPHLLVRFSAPAHPQRIRAELPTPRPPGTAAAQVAGSHSPRTIEMPTAVHPAVAPTVISGQVHRGS